MPVFVEANRAEILRAAQKDESFVNQIRGDLADIVQRLFGKKYNYYTSQELNKVFFFISF